MAHEGASRLVRRLRTKVKREFLRAPIIRSRADYCYHAQLGRHSQNLPYIDYSTFSIFAELRDEGVAVRDVMSVMSARALDAADRVADGLRDDKKFDEDLSWTQMPEIWLPADVPGSLGDSAPLYEWGIADENLDLAEHYIGLPPYFLGASVRRERADGPATFHTRRWHKDIDDRRMLKVIIYLNDVDHGGGPFEYLNREATDRVVQNFRYSAGHLSDPAVSGVVPVTEWRQVTGPRLTAVFVDPTRLLHRARPPTERDRYSLTLAYTSTTPLFDTFPQSRLTQSAIDGLSRELTERQRWAAVIPARRALTIRPTISGATER
jgi:hypothetical protein